MPRRPIDFKLLRELIAPATVLEKAGWQATGHSCGNAVGPCPICRTDKVRDRCFLVGRRFVKCYRCGDFLDAVGLYAALTGTDPYDAAIDLCRRLNLDVPYIDRPLPARRHSTQDP